MKEDNSGSDSGVSRRKAVELVAACSAYVIAVGQAAAVGAAAADASAAAQPSIALIKEMLYRLDSRLMLQGLAVSHLSDIESDYFGDAWRERPQDLWKCMETWPPEALQQAFDMLLPLVAKSR